VSYLSFRLRDCLKAAESRIGCFGERLQCVEELIALAGEKAIGGEGRNRSRGACKLVGQRTNYRDMGEVGADEFARDGEDQAGLDQRIQRAEKIGK
jgi:hypothetical protein